MELPAQSSEHKSFYGSRMGVRDQPDLSQWLTCKRVFLDHNSLRVLYRDLFPPQPTAVYLDHNALYNDGLLHSWPDSIEELDLSHNRFTDTSFTDHWPSQLKRLYLNDGELDTLPLNLPESLHTLCVNYTQLKELTTLPEQLEVLEAYYCRLKKLSHLPPTLHVLNLSYNYLSSRAVFFQQLPALRFLNLSGNMLTWIPATLPDSIETLLLTHNKLTELPETLPKNLLQVDVSHNRIRSWKPKWKGQRIQQVIVRDNCLTQHPETLTGPNIAVLYYADNWNLELHHICARLIQNAFRIFLLHRMLRQIRRMKQVRNELFEVAYHPDIMGRWNIPDTWDEWKH